MFSRVVIGRLPMNEWQKQVLGSIDWAFAHGGRLTQMSRTDHITILVLALVGLVGVGAVEVLTFIGVQERIKFAVVVATLAVIISGTYWFVLAQSDRRNDRGS
jgi:NADH:ubiquinone oxidoreductase subunit 4 (subunit M)